MAKTISTDRVAAYKEAQRLAKERGIKVTADNGLYNTDEYNALYREVVEKQRAEQAKNLAPKLRKLGYTEEQINGMSTEDKIYAYNKAQQQKEQEAAAKKATTAQKQKETYNEIQNEKKSRNKATADGSGTVLSNYIKNGTKLESSLDLFNASLTQNKKASWFNKVINNASGLANKISNAMSSFQSALNSLQSKFNVDSLLKKMNLGDNKLLKSLASKYGLKSGLLDSWASDIVNVGMSWVNTAIGDLGNGLLQGIMSKLNNWSVFDTVILNSVVKPLRYAGANPNYRNTLLRACLESDMPKCLDYLDGYNGTKYLHNNNMWKRGTYAARHGCWQVPKYICEHLNEGYVTYSASTQTGDPDIAYWYKSKMVEIFKTTLVYGYTVFDTDSFNKFTNVNTSVLRNYSYYGDNDQTFNKRYKINSGDINRMAKIVKVTKFGNSNNKTGVVGGWNDPGAGTTIDISNISHQEPYIDVRNTNIKKLYILMTAPNLSDAERLVNEPLHKRLKYPMLDVLSRANSSMLNTLNNSKTYNDLRYLFDTNGDKNGNGLVAGLIHNSIKELQRVHALRTLDDIYKTTQVGLKKDTTDIGDFRPYVVDDPDTTTKNKIISTDTSTTLSEEETAIDAILDKVVLDPIFTELGLTRKDFAILDTYGLTEEEKTSKISAILNKNSNLKNADTFELKHWNDIDVEYSTKHSFVLYCTHPEKLEDLTETNKEKVRKQILAIELVKQYAKTYSLASMKTWYGKSSNTPVYEKDVNGNIIYDTNGDPNVTGYTFNHTPDKVLSDYLDGLAAIAGELKTYFQNHIGTNRYTVTFDNQGIGENIDTIQNITPLSTLANYAVKGLTDSNRKFVFLGWAEDPYADSFFDFENTYITDDIVLYAIWDEAKNLVTEAKLCKENNSTIEQTVYATIDNVNNIIYFPLKESEKSGGNYVVSLKWSNGAFSNVNDGSYVYLDSDVSQSQKIIISNIYGKKREYSLKITEIPEEAKRIGYIINEGYISGFTEDMLYIAASETKEITLSCERTGFEFEGWCNNTTFANKISSISFDSIVDQCLIYAKLTEIKYDISYLDQTAAPFSGTHASDYALKFTYTKGAKLDKPTKDGYIFLGYFSEPGCGDSALLRNIPRFYASKDIVIYAKWIDAELYKILINGLDIDGVKVDFTRIAFYTRYIVRGGKQWVVTNTGLAIYTSIGDLISRASIGNNCTPIGISYLADNDTFLTVVKTKNGRIHLYKSSDRGITWSFAADITGIGINFFTGTGFETLEFLTFFLRVLYQGLIYEVKDNKIYIDDTVVFSKDNLPGIAEVFDDYSLGGISVTIDGAFYLLFVNDGIYRLTILNGFSIEKYFSPNNPDKATIAVPTVNDLHIEKIKNWVDGDSYKIDTSSIGTAYNNVDPNAESTDLNDDFDIDDEAVRSNILRNAADKFIEVRTYRNASRITFTTSSDGKTVPVYDANYPLDWIWEQNQNSDTDEGRPPALWLAGYRNRAIYQPNITNPKETIILNKKDSSKTKERIVSNTDIFDWHEETITSENWKNYIGWTRKDGTEEILLTQSYMAGIWNVVNKSNETWLVKLDKREVEKINVSHPDGSTTTESVYKGRSKEIVPSEDYTEYKQSGLSGVATLEYANVVAAEQSEKANAYKDQYTVTKNANGSKRYAGISEEFYKYITEGYVKDKEIQETLLGKQGTGTFEGTPHNNTNDR